MLICYMIFLINFGGRSRFGFIVDLKYEKLHSFCSNCKMISHDLSNCRQLQHCQCYFWWEKIVGTKIQQHYRPKVVGAQDGTKGSLDQVESVVEPAMEPMLDF